MGLDVAVTNLATIDMNNYDLTLDHSDLSQIDKVMGVRPHARVLRQLLRLRRRSD